MGSQRELVLLRFGVVSPGAGGRDITGIRRRRDTVPVPLVAVPAYETDITPSPDGRWRAYLSDASGRVEVYLRPFPDDDSEEWQVSTRGARGARGALWSRDSRELFYVDADGTMNAVEITPGTPPPGRTTTLFPVRGRYIKAEYSYSQAVRSNLEQSSAITIVPRTTVIADLARMERPANTPVTLELAQQIAARDGFKGIVDGEVAGVGSSGFVLTLRLLTADSARELASFRQGADGPAQLIDAVDALSRKLRGKIGESLRAVQASPPLAQVTTASIDALPKYTEARRPPVARIG